MTDILRTLLLILEAVSSILLIGIILIQKSKGGGLGGSAFGGSAETIFGARAGNFLTKITIGRTIFFMVNTLALSFFFAGSGDGSLLDAEPVIEDVVPGADQPGADLIFEDVAPADAAVPPPAEPVPAAEEPASQP